MSGQDPVSRFPALAALAAAMGNRTDHRFASEVSDEIARLIGPARPPAPAAEDPFRVDIDPETGAMVIVIDHPRRGPPTDQKPGPGRPGGVGPAAGAPSACPLCKRPY